MAKKNDKEIPVLVSLEIMTKDNDERYRIGDAIHEQLKGNQDYRDSAIILNIEEDRKVRLFIFEDADLSKVPELNQARINKHKEGTTMIDIKSLNKAEVLKTLYDHTHVQGMGFLQAVPEGTVTVEHCEELLKKDTYFDYLYGRVLKVDLSGDEFNEALYDRNNFPGAAAKAIEELRNKQTEKVGETE